MILKKLVVSSSDNKVTITIHLIANLDIETEFD
jgi:hypothetical protein